jgi:hypothetical protein
MNEILGLLLFDAVMAGVIVYFGPDVVGRIRRPRQELPPLLRLLWRNRKRYELEHAPIWPIALILLGVWLMQAVPVALPYSDYPLWARLIALGCAMVELLLLRYMWVHSDPR